jgi:hypothetical protein
MITILVEKHNKNTVNIIQSRFNGTISEAKVHYNTNNVYMYNENNTLKVLYFLIINGVKVTFRDDFYQINLKQESIDITYADLHNLGALSVYNNEQGVCFHTMNYSMKLSQLKILIEAIEKNSSCRFNKDYSVFENSYIIKD